VLLLPVGDNGGVRVEWVVYKEIDKSKVKKKSEAIPVIDLGGP
jgi:hypothetical protein